MNDNDDDDDQDNDDDDSDDNDDDADDTDRWKSTGVWNRWRHDKSSDIKAVSVFKSSSMTIIIRVLFTEFKSSPCKVPQAAQNERNTNTR